MKVVRAALLTLFFAGAAVAQTPGMGETRPLPPSREDPPPALGDSQEPHGPDARPRMPAERDPALTRCPQLVGEPEECLREERSAVGGATRPAEPPTAPPPQNPR